MQKSQSNRTEFSSALAQIAHERKLDPDTILDAIKQAILAAFKKDHPDDYVEEMLYDVQLDPASGEAVIYNDQKKNVTPPGFGRIAAQTAKQVILQKIREAEKGAIVAEYEKRLGSLVSGVVIRLIGGDVVVELDAGKHGRAEAVMPPSEQIYVENYRLNQKLTMYLDSIRDSVRGREVVVSRVNPQIVAELFKREVPEVSSKAVEIRAIAREAGNRTKIAVYSTQSGVDPVGSCVGQKGVRVQAVISELNGEKIDIIQFSEDPEKFVVSALAPATGLTVKIDDKNKIATVVAPADQLSLAIGREGQNAKLAGKLTGYHIDIKGDEIAKSVEKKEDTVADQNTQNPNDDNQTNSNDQEKNDTN